MDQVQTLTTHDRCDACGSTAYVSVEINGTLLMFCAHHYAQFAVKLSDRPTVDERWALVG